MNIVSDNLIDNLVIYEPEYAGADRFINEPTEVNKTYLNDVDFIRINLKYVGNWKLETDIFEFFKPESLEKLRNGRCVLMVDVTLEGWSPKNSQISISLHNSCIKHQIDARKIFYLTSNHRESTCYSVYLYTQYPQLVSNINICENIIISELARSPSLPLNFDSQIKMCEKFHTDKIFLQLSRRVRSARSMANHQLYVHGLVQHGLVSQDKMLDFDVGQTYHEYSRSIYAPPEMTYEAVKKWNEDCLPYVVDYPDFETNWAAENVAVKYHQTLFSIVLETSVEDVGNTSLFLSEKTFKAIMHRHPLIIFGHRGSNHFLRDLGFYTYENYFDISELDYEVDHYKRYQLILSQVKPVIEKLSKMSLQERIKWRFEHRHILEHNYEQLVNSRHSIMIANRLHETIKSYFDQRFLSQFSPNPHQ
jgi:hypothetical protein